MRRFFAGLYLLFRFSYVTFLVAPVFPLLIVSFQVGLSFIMAAMKLYYDHIKQLLTT